MPKINVGLALLLAAGNAWTQDTAEPQILVYAAQHGKETVIKKSQRKAFKPSMLEALKTDTYSKEKTVLILEGVMSEEVSYFGRHPTQKLLEVSPKTKKSLPSAAWDEIGSVVLADYRSPNEPTFDESFQDAFRRCWNTLGAPAERGKIHLDVALRMPLPIDPHCFTDGERVAAGRFSAENLAFELFQAQLAKHYASQNYQVLLVVGGIHALRMMTFFDSFEATYYYSTDALDKVANSTRMYRFLDSLATTGSLPQSYSPDAFEFSPSQLPKAYRDGITSNIMTSKEPFEELRSPRREQYAALKENHRFLIFSRDAISVKEEPASGREITLSLTRERSYPLIYVASGDLTHGGVVTGLEFTAGDVPHRVSVPAMFFIAPDDLPSFGWDEILGMSF